MSCAPRGSPVSIVLIILLLMIFLMGRLCRKQQFVLIRYSLIIWSRYSDRLCIACQPKLTTICLNRGRKAIWPPPDFHHMLKHLSIYYTFDLLHSMDLGTAPARTDSQGHTSVKMSKASPANKSKPLHSA